MKKSERIHVKCDETRKILRFGLVGCGGSDTIALTSISKAAISDADVMDALEAAEHRLWHFVLHPGIRKRLLDQVRRKIEKTRAKIKVVA